MHSPTGEYRESHYEDFAITSEATEYMLKAEVYSSVSHMFVRDALTDMNGKVFQIHNTSSCQVSGW